VIRARRTSCDSQVVGRGVSLRAAYSLHDARYVDSLRDLGAGPVQLAGNRLPMSPRNLASFGVLYHPSNGFFCHADIQYVGDRYMNEENTALAAAYTTWSAGIGWQQKSWQIRLDGQNLSDNRSPSALSEMGDGQVYRVYPRHITLGFRWAF
jgi:outer membrane receptor protein involved in Fe transport